MDITLHPNQQQNNRDYILSLNPDMNILSWNVNDIKGRRTKTTKNKTD